jgi:hypothetical protein
MPKRRLAAILGVSYQFLLIDRRINKEFQRRFPNDEHRNNPLWVYKAKLREKM